MLSIQMGNLLACTTSQSSAPSGDDFLAGDDILPQAVPKLSLSRSCSQEASNPAPQFDLFSADLDSIPVQQASSSSSGGLKQKLSNLFGKKKKKSASMDASATPAAPKPKPAKAKPSFVDDRPRFGLAELNSVQSNTKESIAAMSLDALLVELGTLAGVKSVRVQEVERILREAEAKLAEVKRLEAAMRTPKVAPAPAVSASAVPAAPVAPPADIVVSNTAPQAPPLDGYVAPAKAGLQQNQKWAKGTGYGYHGASGSWSIDSYMSGLKTKQQTIQFICRKISDRLDGKQVVEYEQLAQSTLMPFLESYLCNDSMNEIFEQHSELYSDIFSLVAHMLAYGAPKVSPFLPLLQGKCAAYIKKIGKSAELVEKIDGKAPAAASASASSTAAPVFTITSYVLDLARTLDAILSLPKEEAQAMSVDVEASMGGGASLEPEPSTERENSVSSNSVSSASAGEESPVPAASAEKVAASTEGKASPAELAEYVKQLSEHRFGEVEEFDYHKYMKENKGSASSAPISRAFTKRLAVEYADLAESLPQHFDSSVWMRAHESQMSYAQMMISGPDNTPYENGLFLFDVSFPPTYPQVPPHVNLQTTGKGSVRFNPNLYHCGKVCLSILGTWSGGVGEGWSAKSSTMLQVAVSIQSLVFVPQPYFNEPGYENQMHTPSGQQQSDAYSQPLLHGTMKWAMLDILQHPPKGFEDVVRKHFFLKKDRILKQAEEWSKKNDQIPSLLPELKKELEKLKL